MAEKKITITGHIREPVKMTAQLSRATAYYEKDYEKLDNLPQINDTTLIGNKSFSDLGLNEMGALQIMQIWEKVFNE